MLRVSFVPTISASGHDDREHNRNQQQNSFQAFGIISPRPKKSRIEHRGPRLDLGDRSYGPPFSRGPIHHLQRDP